MVCLSWVQQRLLRVGGLPVGVPDLVPVTLASNAVSLSLPAGTLFAEGYTFRQYQWLGASQVLAIWSQLSAGALATAALAAVAVAGAAAAPGLRLELLPVLTFVLAGALVAAALFRRAPLLGSLIGRTLRGAERFLPPSVCRHLRSAQVALRQMNNFNPPPRLWLACFGVAALNWMLGLGRPDNGLADGGGAGALERDPYFLCGGPDPGGAAHYAWRSGLGGGRPGGGADQVPRPGLAGHGGHPGVPRRQLLATAPGGLVGRALLDAAQPPRHPSCSHGGHPARLRELTTTPTAARWLRVQGAADCSRWRLLCSRELSHAAGTAITTTKTMLARAP